MAEPTSERAALTTLLELFDRPGGLTENEAEWQAAFDQARRELGAGHATSLESDRATCPAHGGDYHWALDCPACVQDARERGMSIDTYYSRVRPTLRPNDRVAAMQELIQAARRVAFTNGFDAAYPINLEKLRYLLQRHFPLDMKTGGEAAA